MSEAPLGRGVRIRALADEGRFLAIACVSTGVVEEARRRHNLYPTAAAALGRLLTAAALMAATLKGREKVMLQVLGDGPIRHLVAEGDARGALRGYAGGPRVHLPANDAGKLDVAGAVGKGRLVVIRDLGLKEPYVGSVQLVSGEIAEDVAYYLSRSEQTPSAVGLGVLVGPDHRVQVAGGWLVTPLPGAAPEALEALERRARAAPPVTQLLSRSARPHPLLLLRPLFDGISLQVLERRTIRYRCTCSRTRFEAGLVALGAQELNRLADERPFTELVCRFCGKTYLIPAERMRQLAARAQGPRIHPTTAERWPER